MKWQEISTLRKRLKMTQEEFAKALGLADRSAVCNLEKGRRGISGPIAATLRRLAESVKTAG